MKKKVSDLVVGDEIQVRVMGGSEYLEVVDVKGWEDESRRQVKLSWGLHIPREPFWDTLASDKELMVK